MGIQTRKKEFHFFDIFSSLPRILLCSFSKREGTEREHTIRNKFFLDGLIYLCHLLSLAFENIKKNNYYPNSDKKKLLNLNHQVQDLERNEC